MRDTRTPEGSGRVRRGAVLDCGLRGRGRPALAFSEPDRRRGDHRRPEPRAGKPERPPRRGPQRRPRREPRTRRGEAGHRAPTDPPARSAFRLAGRLRSAGRLRLAGRLRSAGRLRLAGRLRPAGRRRSVRCADRVMNRRGPRRPEVAGSRGTVAGPIRGSERIGRLPRARTDRHELLGRADPFPRQADDVPVPRLGVSRAVHASLFPIYRTLQRFPAHDETGSVALGE